MIANQITLFPIRYFLANVSFINCHYFQLIIFPHNLCIVDYVVAVPGSLHNSSAFQLAEIAKTPGMFLQPNKWLWADTACGCHFWCIVPFKKPAGGNLTRDQKKFNYHLSKVTG